MGNFKKTSKKTVTQIDTYHVTKELKYCISYVNDKEDKRYLKYTEKKINGYDLRPIYKEDLSLLKETNPFWDNFKWLAGDDLPDLDTFDIKNVILIQSASHTFYNLDKSPIPVIHKADYMHGFDNRNYDLVKLKNHLESNPNVIKVSEILDIPYYNCDEAYDNYEARNKQICFSVMPTKECLEEGYSIGMKDTKEIVFGKYYDKNGYDFLGIKKFSKEIDV